MAKIVAFEQDRFASFLGEGVSQAISEVQLSGVPRTPSEIPIGLTGDSRLLSSHFRDGDVVGHKEGI